MQGRTPADIGVPVKTGPSALKSNKFSNLLRCRKQLHTAHSQLHHCSDVGILPGYSGTDRSYYMQ